MITLKIKKILHFIIESFLIVFLVAFSGVSAYVTKAVFTIESPSVKTIIEGSSSIILDSEENNITTLNLVNTNSVTYEDLPDVFINALVSAEDARFFVHSGVDFQRIISALINNIMGNSIQGASTLTQQLIKNIYLDSSKTFDRKIKEIIMAFNLENKLSKEDILLTYANNIMFDGVTLGVNSASLKLFSKPINNINLAEAALLAGLVNAPSYYNPLKNPLNAKDRMDTVLNLMYRHNYITENQLINTKKVQISDIINLTNHSEDTYPYQSYLDIVYNEVINLTGYNPLTTPLIVETYMDTDLQGLIDSIQSNQDSAIQFSDDNQQIAISVIDNKNGALIAAGGGRNYNGLFLFNRAIDMQNQPASTMKPILSYALAIEYLGWNNNKMLLDEETTYPNTDTTVNNIDHKYMGNILIDQAIGYSRNTTAVNTLKEVIDEIGVNKVTDYLKSIYLLDVDPNEFNYSYALGAMQYGVSPTQMASAYSMLASKGVYTEAYTVKSIRLQETNELIYTHQNESKQVLSEETAYIMSDILKSVVDNNYYNMGAVKIDGVEIHAKSGTSSFDSSILKEYNYPSDASKDIWFAGYSADYTTVVWSGFDTPIKEETNYFKSGTDNRKYIPRKVFSKIMNYQAKKGETISIPYSLTYVNCVKGTEFLPDEFTPSNMVKKALYKKGKEPYINISPPELDNISDVDIMIIGHNMYVSFENDDYTELDVSDYYIDYMKLYGDIEYIIETTNSLGTTSIYKSSTPSFSFSVLESGILKIKAYTRYAKIINFTSNIIEKEFDNPFSI